VALIKRRLELEAVATPGRTGQFEVIVDGKSIVERGGNWLTRSFGAGYPDPENVVELLRSTARGRSTANAPRSA